MTDGHRISPAPGWFPDPSNPEQMRWWDGVRWTEYRQPVQPTAFNQNTQNFQPLAAPYAAPHNPHQRMNPFVSPLPLKPEEPTNPFATNAVWAGSVSLMGALAGKYFIFSLLGGLIAITWGIFGFIRMAKNGVGKSRAITGTALGGAAFLITAAILLTDFLPNALYDQQEIESAIKEDLEDQSQESLKSVLCPTSPSFTEGAQFECIVRDRDGVNWFVEVRVQDNQGSYVWEVTG